MLDRLVVIPLLVLAAGAPTYAATPPPGEKALFAWADRCPSTAMKAGLYTAGARVDGATFDGREVLRVFIRDTTVTPATETTWLLGAECRAVGIVRADAAPGRPRAVGFVVAKETGAPTAAEQAALLAWAGKPEAAASTWRSADVGPSGTSCPCWEVGDP